MKTQLNFAVLVDGENIPNRHYKEILSEVERKGTVAIKWVYADWTMPNHKSWQPLIFDTASSARQQFNMGKDSADHALIMDAIELICSNTAINAICIVSSDGGFAGLAQRIREKGLHVMAIGRKNTPPRFRSACHDFVYLDNLGLESNEESADEFDHTDSDLSTLDELLLKAFWQIADNEDFAYLGDFGTKLKQIDSTFDVRSYGYRSLKKVIKNLSSQLEIFGEEEDRCYVRLTALNGKLKAKPQSGKDYAFIVHNDEEFHFNKKDLNDSKEWGQLDSGMSIRFQLASSHTGKARSACNVELINR